ncbi:MAG: hypothetical protein WBA76_10595 [Phormidesmis sp.]
MSKIFFGAVGLALMSLGMQLPVSAQAIQAQSEAQSAKVQAMEAQPAEALVIEMQANEGVQVSNEQAAQPIEAASWTQPESLAANELMAPEAAPEQMTSTEADALAYPAADEPAEVAQARRRTRNAVSGRGSDFIGIGADFGTASDISFAVISKLSFNEALSVRPSVIVGDDLAVLVPVTFDFNRFNADVEGFQIRPYAGAGVSYVDNSSDSNIGVLLSAGVDVPVSRNFTANAQANYAGVFSDSDNFGVTVGVGYNFGGLIR